MAILRNDTTVRSADGQSTSSIITAANIGNYGISTTSTYYIGTTQNVFNRASGAQTLTGVSIDGNAATVTNGVYTTGAQTIGGTKTFSDGVVVNGATYYTFNKPTTTNYQTVALFGSASGGLFLTTDSAIIGVGAYYNAGWIATATSGRHIDFAGGTFNFNVFSGATVGGTANWGSVATLNSSGTFSATGDFRAPIFYDTNNTAYYCDPASVSNLNAVTLNRSGSDGYLTLPGSVTVSNVSAAEMVIRGLSQLRFSNSTSWDWNSWAGLRYDNAGTTIYLGGPAATSVFTANASPPTVTVSFVGTNNVTSDSNFKGPIFYDSANTAYYLDPANTGTSLLVAGNVGIGTTSPTTKLAISDGTTIAQVNPYSGVAYFGTVNNYPMALSVNSSEKVRIQTDGNVGIGTTSPSQKLHVVGTGFASTDFRAPIFYDSDNTAYYIDAASTSNLNSLVVASSARVGGAASRSTSGLTVGFTDNSTFAANTDVGDTDRMLSIVNESSTTNAMSVLGFRVNPNGGTANAMMDIKFVQTGATNTSALHYTFNHGGTFADRFSILSSGNVGFGTTSPYGKIDLGSNTGAKLFIYGNGGNVGYITGLGTDISGSSALSFFTGTGRFEWVKGSGNYPYSSYALQAILDASSNFIVTSSVRTPIFYDSDNTSYYLDAASTTVLNALSVSVNNGLNPAVGIWHTSSEGKARFYFASNDTTYFRTGNNFIFRNNSDIGVVTIDSVGNLRTSTSGDNFASYSLHVGGTGFASADFRSPIFYDSNDTAYYIDAASTSVLNRLNYTQLRRNFGASVYSGPPSGSNLVKTFSGVLVAGSANGSTNTYTVIETSIPQGNYQMGGFTINWFENYSSTNGKTTIEIAGYWNPTSNGGFIGFEFTSSNPNIQPTIQVGANASGNTVFILTHYSSNYPVIVARDLWFGYNSSDAEYGTGWTMTNTNSIAAYTNLVTATLRVGPTLTGTGATGTWSINVSGNAGTLTYYPNRTDSTTYPILWGAGSSTTPAYSCASTYIQSSTGTIYANGFYDAGNTAYYLDPNSSSNLNNVTVAGTLTLTNIAKNSTGPIVINSGQSASLGLRVYYDMNLYNTLVFTDSSWNSQGRIFGSSSVVTIQAATTTTSFVKYAGYSEEGGSFRAPIFYDSDNTSYYIDAAGTSSLNILNVASYIDVSTYIYLRNNLRMLNSAGNGWLETIVRNSGSPYFQNSIDGGTFLASDVSENNNWLFQENVRGWGIFYFNKGTQSGQTFGSYTTIGAETFIIGQGTGTTMTSTWTGYNASSKVAIMLSNYTGYIWANDTIFSATGMRAPIFYDSDNTSYYIDAASTSLLNATRSVSIVAGSNSAMTGSPGSLAVYSASSPYISFHDGGVARTAYLQEAGGRFYFGDVPYTESEGSFRAPLFYDVNDTTYYLDPAAATSLNIAGQITTAKTNGTLFSIAGVDTIGYNSTAGRGAYIKGTGSTYVYGSAMFADGANFRQMLYEDTWLNSKYFDSNGIIYSQTSMRAPIFFDYNDTAYYVDPASSTISSYLKASQLIGNYKIFTINDLSASGTQARTFEIARLGIDYNDWNTVGTFEVELHEKYWSQGLKKVYNIWYGYVSNSGIKLVEWRGAGTNNFQCRIGTQVQISGDSYYLPVYVDVRNYGIVDVVIKTNRNYTTTTGPAIGYTYINTVPSATNISDFTADSDLEISTLNNAKLNGNPILSSYNYTSYTLPIGGSWYGVNLPGTRWNGMSVNGGEIVFGRDLPNNGQMGILVDGCYIAGENNGFWSLSSSNDWTTRRGMYWDGTYLNFTTNSAISLFSDARSPRFYDSDNTSYYVDPASTSVLNVLTFTSDITLKKNNSRNLEVQGVGSTDCGIVGKGAGGEFAFQIYGNNNSEYGFLNGVWASWDMRKVPNGNLYLNNNNTYYLNPPSTTYLNNLTVANTITGSITGNAGGSSASCTGNAATATRTSSQSGYPHAGTGMFAFYNWGGSDGGTSAPSASTYTTGLSVGSNPGDQAYGFQIANNMWNTGLWTRNYNSGFGSWIRLLDSSNYVGYSAFTGNVDGTQFRDANNTAYYIDPASTSNLVGLTVANTITGAVSGNAGSVTINYNNDSNSTYQMLWGSGNNVYGTAGVYLNPSTDYVTATSFNASDWFRSSGATGWYNSTYGGGIYMTDTTWVRTYNSKYFYCDTIIQAGSDMRSPVYYDANDTAYYVDAASTSNLLLVKTRNTFGERVAVSATASTTINTQYNVTELTLAATITTLTLSNIQASGTVHMWTIVTVGGGVGYSITWPAAVKWPGGTAPTLTTTSNKRDIYQFVTYDGGTTIFAIIVGQNL